MAPGKSGLHARGEGERVLALEQRASGSSAVLGAAPPLSATEQAEAEPAWPCLKLLSASNCPGLCVRPPAFPERPEPSGPSSLGSRRGACSLHFQV